jgi:hypothetical protein
MNVAAQRALESLVANDTIRVGRLMSPLAVRYFVVPLGEQPSLAAQKLVESLSNQLDLRRTYFARDLVIFENVSWLPIVSVLDEESSVASQQASDVALTSQNLKSVSPLVVDENSVADKIARTQFAGGTVHVAVPFDSRWHLVVDGAQLTPRVAFGASTAFDAPIAGVASLEYQTSIQRYVFLTLQALAWLALLILAANISRFRGRMQKIGSQRVKLITDPAQPEQKIDLANR